MLRAVCNARLISFQLFAYASQLNSIGYIYCLLLGFLCGCSLCNVAF